MEQDPCSKKTVHYTLETKSDRRGVTQCKRGGNILETYVMRRSRILTCEARFNECIVKSSTNLPGLRLEQ
jgi:hypothetical protein